MREEKINITLELKIPNTNKKLSEIETSKDGCKSVIKGDDGSLCQGANCFNCCFSKTFEGVFDKIKEQIL